MSAGLRLRTGRARAKAREIIVETLNDEAVTRILVIAGTRDGNHWTVIPGGMSGRDMAGALAAAAEGLRRYVEHERQLAKVGQPARIDVTERGDGPLADREGAALPPACRISPEGAIQAPPGEAFTFCGECGGNRWYATAVNEPMGPMRRIVCVGCGNEVAVHQVAHEGGRA